MALVNSYDVAQRHAMLSLCVIPADLLHQISVDGREVRDFLTAFEHNLLVRVFLVENDDGEGLDAVRQFLALLYLEGIDQRVAPFLYLYWIDFSFNISCRQDNSQYKLLREVDFRGLTILAHSCCHSE